jgi:hypothetical protein
LIDSCALTDRFLADLPFTPNPTSTWKPGHYERTIPDGYEQAIKAADANFMKDINARGHLSEVWAQIRPIESSD